MTEFRYMAVDFVSGEVIGPLPLFDVSFGCVLNGAGPMTASLRLPDDDLDLASAYVDACEETKRALYIEYGDTVLWAGPIWISEYDTDTQTLKIGGAEMWSYFRRRRIRWDWDYTQIDQLVIASSLIERSALGLSGDLGLTIGAGTSGVLRDRVYRVFEDKNLGEAIEQLSQVIDGFDFAIEVERVGTTYTRTWQPYYPQKGRPIAESGLYLTMGNNALKLNLPRNGTGTANSVLAIGAGEGLDMLRATATDLDILDAGYPLLEDSVSYKDVKIEDTLTAHAQAELAARKRPVSLPTVTMLLDTDPRLGTYQTGDEALIRVLPATEPRWWAGIEFTARLNSFVVRPPDDGEVPIVELAFEELVA